MENHDSQENRQKRDFYILFFSLVSFSCITVFTMNRFWWLESRYTAILMLVLSAISFIPAAAGVRHFRRIVMLFMSAGMICIAAALFMMLPS